VARYLNQRDIRNAVSRKTNTDPLLVYQMGKVGSTSILAGLESRLPDTPVFHVHTLSSPQLRVIENIYRNSWRDPQKRPKNSNQPLHLWHSQYLEKRLADDRGQRRWRIITLVRDPVARAISEFFEVLHLQYDYDYQGLIRERSIEEVVEGARRLFMESHGAQSEAFSMAWFDRELKSVFGVDVSASPFPRATGYAIYRDGRVDVLLLKLEKLNDCAKAAFGEFLGLDQFEIPRVNDSSRKAYREVYRSFIDHFRLPVPFLDEVYASSWVELFYDADEIAAFKRRWSE
jgi:hypothetical protein